MQMMRSGGLGALAERVDPIDRVGVELEGNWTREDNGVPWVSNNQGKLQADSSVSDLLDNGFSGEFVSPPLPPEKVRAWVLGCYPDAIDRSCGLHVHVSLKSKRDYEFLATPQYGRYLRFRLRGWGHLHNVKNKAFWNRLEGGNVYCEKLCARKVEAELLIRRQIRAESKDAVRYRQINACYALHGTLEHRLLPMFNDPTVATGAIMELLSIVRKFLYLCRGTRCRPNKTARIGRNFLPAIAVKEKRNDDGSLLPLYGSQETDYSCPNHNGITSDAAWFSDRLGVGPLHYHRVPAPGCDDPHYILCSRTEEICV